MFDETKEAAAKKTPASKKQSTPVVENHLQENLQEMGITPSDEFLNEMNAPVTQDEPTPEFTNAIDQAKADSEAQLEETDFDAMFREAEAKKTSEMSEITAEYLDIKKIPEGGHLDFIALGMTTFPNEKGEMRPAVRLIDRERKSFIFGGTVALSAIGKIEKLPAAIRIQYNGMKKGKNGNYFDIKVYTV